MSKAHIFSEKHTVTDEAILDSCGKRGQRAFELATLNLPIVPGFILDSITCLKLEHLNLDELLPPALKIIEEGIGRKFGDADNPLLLKLVGSSNLTLPIYPTVFNIGLSPKTIPSFAKMLNSEQKAWFEYCYFLRSVGEKLYNIEKEKFDDIEEKADGSIEAQKNCAAKMKKLIGEDKVSDEPLEQLKSLIKVAAKCYYDPDLDDSDNIAIMIQGMVFGNLDASGLVGMYHTRNMITGASKLNGYFQRNVYTLEKKETEINELDEKYLTELKRIAQLLETRFHELREVKLIVEKEKLWLINQTSEDKKSTQAHLRTLLELHKRQSCYFRMAYQTITAQPTCQLIASYYRTNFCRKNTKHIWRSIGFTGRGCW